MSGSGEHEARRHLYESLQRHIDCARINVMHELDGDKGEVTERLTISLPEGRFIIDGDFKLMWYDH